MVNLVSKVFKLWCKLTASNTVDYYGYSKVFNNTFFSTFPVKAGGLQGLIILLLVDLSFLFVIKFHVNKISVWIKSWKTKVDAVKSASLIFGKFLN